MVILYLSCGSANAVPDKYEEDKCRSAFEENPQAKDPLKTRALVMAVFGDSIMWGQGLKERDKFWCRAKQWLELKTGRDVVPNIYAHAGAVIDENSLLSQKYGKNSYELILNTEGQGEEVNLSFPTIQQQVSNAAYALREKTVDLVLVDGCINDLNFRTLLNAGKPVEDIEQATETSCGKPMQGLLGRINEKFPSAQIIVNGYYPLVYKGMPVIKDGRLEFKKGTAKNQLMTLLIRQLGEKTTCRDGNHVYVCLDRISRAWHETSNKVLKNAVTEVNRSISKENELIHFAELHFPPEYGFSTKQSMLWNFRFAATNVGGFRKLVAVTLDFVRALDTNDDRWDLRQKQCHTAEKEFNKQLKRLPAEKEEHVKVRKDVKAQLRWFESVCERGSLAHPNRFGAALYAQTVIGQLDTIVPKTRWMEPDAVR